MVRQPRVFLMDEPLSNLDARLRVHMRGELSELHSRLGATFVYVTHDQVEAMTMSTRVALMMDGEIVQVAPPDEIYADPVDVRVARFIGSPEINLLPATTDEDGQVVLGGRPTALHGAGQGELTIGLRPEALCINGPDMALAVEARLQRMENLGPDVLLHVRHDLGGDGRATLRLPHAEVERLRQEGQLDGVFSIGAQAKDALLFGPDGRRVTAVRKGSGMEAGLSDARLRRVG
jgi:multiple sugar transport system ATP-binding protein